MKCPKCGSLMIDTQMYDPDGMVPLIQHKDNEKYFACLNLTCEDGRKNEGNS